MSTNNKLPEPAKSIIARLTSELSKDLCYHSAQHTLEVIDECLVLAQADKLDSRQIELLVVAAAYHDSGFLFRYEENEELGAKLALEDLKDIYSSKDLEEIKNCILSTKLNRDLSRTPLSELSKYLLDADLANLGKDNIFEKTELLAKETKQNLNELYRTTFALMQKHQWLTPAGKKLREKEKEKNIEQIKAILKQTN